MYRLIYKSTVGSPADKNTSEYSVWRQETPSDFEKELLIEHMAKENSYEGRYTPSYGDEVATENYKQTVAIQYKGNAPEVVYTTKEAKETVLYSDGTYTVDEGISHEYNDKYFNFEGPFNSTKKITINE